MWRKNKTVVGANIKAVHKLNRSHESATMLACSASVAMRCSSARAFARLASALREASNKRISVAVAAANAAAAAFSAFVAAAADADEVEVDDGEVTDGDEDDEVEDRWDALALVWFGEGVDDGEDVTAAADTGRGRKRRDGDVGLRRPTRRRCCCCEGSVALVTSRAAVGAVG